MRCFNLLVAVMALGVVAVAQGPTYDLGRTASEEEIRAWGIPAIGPEGKELPPGSGTAKEGAKIYAEKCAACHGPTGREPTFKFLGRALVGGRDTLTTLHPRRTTGSWPFATTIWDYIKRAMPYGQEGTLSADEVYALTAFLLYQNGVIQESDVMDAQSLPKLKMPNRDGFYPVRPEYKPRVPRPFGFYR